MKNCIFCKIVKHEVDSHIIYEDSSVIAVLDIDPITDGHTLVIPKKDIRDISGLDAKTGSCLMNIAKNLASIIERTFEFDGIEIRAVSGYFQDIPHFHLHVFGRNKTNDIKIIYPEGIDNSDKHLTQIEKKIKAGLKREIQTIEV